ncbi:unnamed protein product [Ostreobium quekettii]|uniref:Carbohydrate kinase PfkB domain-containing protein n=1 Tax=Ostreobium quekettii TaxID=121088 RepID=A0A8S1IT49_9CHLO|nr:unnamed protein product [Ostreobium quekettii]
MHMFITVEQQCMFPGQLGCVSMSQNDTSLPKILPCGSWFLEWQQFIVGSRQEKLLMLLCPWAKGNQRKLRVLSTTGKLLSLRHVPWHCRLSRVVLLAPLIPEDLNAAEFVKFSGFFQWLLPQHIGLMAQGFQRGTGSKGEVMAFEQPSQQLMDGLGPGVSVFLSDVETDSWQKETLSSVVNRADRLLITRGGDGATEYSNGAVKHIPVQKVEVLEDTNGAGDTFATAYMLALARRDASPGAEAARAAARTVMRPQVCKPWCIGEDMDLPLSPPKKDGGANRGTIASLLRGMSSTVFLKTGAVRDFLRAQARNRDCMA